MKRRFLIFFLIVSLIAGVAYAASLRPFAFPFIGKWQQSEDPMLIDDYGLQDVQNLRRDGKRLKGVSGHTKINTSVWDSTYKYPKNGFHFKKDFPNKESHVLLYAEDSAGGNGRVYRNTTAIPSAGDFSATVLHTNLTGAGGGRFSNAPQGNVVYTDGSEAKIWGGDEQYPVAFITSTAAITYAATSARDYTLEVSNNLTSNDQVAIIGGGLDSYTKLLMHMDEADGGTNFDDAVGTHNPGNQGNAQTDTDQAKFGISSGLFDGNGDYVTIADHADFNLSNGELTIDFWVRFAALPAANQSMVIYSQRADASNMAVLTLKNLGSKYTFDLVLKTAAVNVYPIRDVEWSSPALNTWYHVAVIRGWGGNSNDWAITVTGTALTYATLSTTYPDVGAAYQIGLGGTEDVGNSKYPQEFSDTYVKATTKNSTDYWAYYATNPIKDLQNADTSNGWKAAAGTFTNQRFHIDLGTATVVTRFGYENYHHNGANTDQGVKNFTLWGSNTASAFAELTYAADTGWTQLTTSASTLDQNSGTNPDVKYITVTNSTAYRYYAFKFADTYQGGPDSMGIRRVELNPTTNIAFNGWIDEYRITKGASRWTETFTPPIRPYSSASRTWLVGYYRPLQGVKYYIGEANAIASTMTVKEWQGNSWVTLTATDNTDTGPSLALTGSVTWTSTNLAEVRYIEGLSLYWYQFSIDAGEATIYQVTVDSPIDNIRNIWDGQELAAGSVKLYEDSTYKDYTDAANEDSTTSVITLDGLTATTEYLLLGFTTPQQGFNIRFFPGKENSTATVLSVFYWDGADWAYVKGLSDGTAQPSWISFAKSGVITFQSIPSGSEFTRSVSSETPLYWYKLVWSVALDAEVEAYYITGIPAPRQLLGYKFADTFQSRTFLFKENYGIYSAYNAPDIYNGSDSGFIYFGGKNEVVGSAKIYNVFQTTGYEQLLVFKHNETYRLVGTGPTDWELKQMSGNVGCIAPLSIAVCEIADVGDGTRRHVAIWQSSHGVVMSDGATIQTISDDIKDYWDANKSEYIPTSRQDDSQGWYDPNLKVYKLLISSGVGQSTHNVELEYSLKTQEWTKVYRENSTGANPLQVGFQVSDTTGNVYTYGATNEGYMYRLENGYTWDGTPISQYLHTRDMILDDQKPMFRDSVIRHLRTVLVQKSTGAGEDIGILHYCDGTTTASVDGVFDYALPTDIDMADGRIDTQDVYLGPCLTHSFKFYADVSTVADGMELLGLGIYYEPLETIRVTR